jgi:hypothetical protein
MAMLNNQRVYANSDLITGNKKMTNTRAFFLPLKLGQFHQ